MPTPRRDSKRSGHAITPRTPGLWRGRVELAPDFEEPIPTDEELPMPPEWGHMADGRPMPNVVRALRRSREGH